MNGDEKNLDVKFILESILGCKWSLSVLDAIQNGVTRPGQLERSIEGISSKVLSERLKKLSRFQILERVEYPEIPPRVEYQFTDQGQKLIQILDAIQDLQKKWE